MSKVFLYLYPIKEYASAFVPFMYIDDEKLSDSERKMREEPFEVLNETIDERYRKNGYKIVYANFKDKDIYGINLKKDDKVIYADMTYRDFTATYDYPNSQVLIDQLGIVDELIIGGYHALDCVKKVGEKALENNINTLVDLELTDLFFSAYKDTRYFTKLAYDPYKFKIYMVNKKGYEMVSLLTKMFERNYSSPVYGYNRGKVISKH